MTSSDSDEEVGRRIDYSSDEDKPKKSKDKKRKPRRPTHEEEEEKPKRNRGNLPSLRSSPPNTQSPTPTPAPPKQQRLTQARRNQIIANFELGSEDPEYSVTKSTDGRYTVRKRKTFFTPTAAVHTGTPNSEIALTWMNMQNELNEGLSKDLKKLKKNYEKLAAKYEEQNTTLPPPPPEPEPTPQPQPQPTPQNPEPIRPPRPVPRIGRSNRKGFTYTRGGVKTINDY
jgi:hypothetical protein